MKQLECKNGELIKVDSSLYNKLSKYSWNVYYQANRKPRIVARVKGVETNITHLIFNLDKPGRHSWHLVNGDEFDYRKNNVDILKKQETAKAYISDKEHREWKLKAKDRGCSVSELIRVATNKECRK